jgi:hypothetical protein
MNFIEYQKNRFVNLSNVSTVTVNDSGPIYFCIAGEPDEDYRVGDDFRYKFFNAIRGIANGT